VEGASRTVFVSLSLFSSNHQAHDAAVCKLSWAHPEFGSIIASCSLDRTVKIWEEAPASAEAESPQVNVNGTGTLRQHSPSGQATGSTSRWAERASLVDAKGTVRVVEFAPHHFGLKLVCPLISVGRRLACPFVLLSCPTLKATISSDNNIRVYECLEQPSLKSWQLCEEVDINTLPSSSPLYLMQGHTVALATPTQTSTPHDGASAPLVAQALQQSQSGMQGSQSRSGTGSREADGGWCISWCKDRYWGEVIAAGCGISGIVKVSGNPRCLRPPVEGLPCIDHSSLTLAASDHSSCARSLSPATNRYRGNTGVREADTVRHHVCGVGSLVRPLVPPDRYRRTRRPRPHMADQTWSGRRRR
jgi:nucleoporin SEH1